MVGIDNDRGIPEFLSFLWAISIHVIHVCMLHSMKSVSSPWSQEGKKTRSPQLFFYKRAHFVFWFLWSTFYFMGNRVTSAGGICHHHYASTPQPGPYIDRWDGKWKTPVQETQELMPSFCLNTIHLNHVLPNSFYSKYQSEHLRAPDRILKVHGSEEGWVLARSRRRIPHLGALWPATQQNWVWGHFHHGKQAAEVSGHPSQQQLPVIAACSWLPALATRIKLAFISDQPFDLTVAIAIWDNAWVNSSDKPFTSNRQYMATFSWVLHWCFLKSLCSFSHRSTYTNHGVTAGLSHTQARCRSRPPSFKAWHSLLCSHMMLQPQQNGTALLQQQKTRRETMTAGADKGFCSDSGWSSFSS